MGTLMGKPMGELLTADRTTTRATDETYKSFITNKTLTIDDLVNRFLELLLKIKPDIGGSQDIKEYSNEALKEKLNAAAWLLAKKPAKELLDLLAENGFAWRDIARMVNVSVPALRRWRNGESPTADHLNSILRLVALVQILQNDHDISDVAAWMEMTLTSDAQVTAIDVVAGGHLEDLISLAAGYIIPEKLLGILDRDWKKHCKSNVEVFEAADGEFGLRLSRMEDI